MMRDREVSSGKLDAIQRTSKFLTWSSPNNVRQYAQDIQILYGVGSPEDGAAAQGAKDMADAGLAAGQKPR